MSKKIIWPLLLSLFFCIVLVARCGASDYYVDAGAGSDSSGDGSQASPWQTITHALDSVTGSEANPTRIYVATGTYDTSLGEVFALEMKDYVSLLGEGADLAIIDADATQRAILCDHVNNFMISGFTITGGRVGEADHPWQYGGGILCFGSSPLIQDCKITGNRAIRGGGIACWGNASPLIGRCELTYNRPSYSGGGMQCWESSSPTMYDCIVAYNSTGDDGGGLFLSGESPHTIYNCLIIGNSASTGAGICCTGGSPAIVNCTIAGHSGYSSAGIFCTATGSPTVENSIIWNSGGEILLLESASITITYSDIHGGYAGTGNIDDDPMFVDGLLGDHYLDPESPCMNAGSQSSADTRLLDKTTRTDEARDIGTVDIGYHYPISGAKPQYLRIASPPDFYYNMILLSWTPIKEASHYLFEYQIGGKTFSIELTDNWFRLTAGDQWVWAFSVSLGTIRYRVSALNDSGAVVEEPTDWANCTCY